MAVESDPGAGDPEAIHAIASARSAKATELRTVHTTITSASRDAAGAAWTGASQISFSAAIGSVAPDLKLLVDGLDAQASALHSYADQVQQIKHEQTALASSRGQAQDTLALNRIRLTAGVLGDRGEQDIRDDQQRLSHVQSQWDDLVARRRHADATCAAALSGSTVLGKTAAFTPAVIGSTSPDALLGMLTGLSPADLRALLAAHPELASKIAKADPTAVAAWWKSMDRDPASSTVDENPSALQSALIDAIPAVIGNLSGVAFWARDRANVRSLDARIARAMKDPQANADELKTLTAVKKALGKGMDGTPPHELISFTMGQNPKAAVAVGDLDRASNITYMVPGMGTTVAANMTGYTNAATGLWREQGVVSGADPFTLAVVAWLDYTPPGSADVIGMAHDYLAEAGAARLDSSLGGLDAVRTTYGSSPTVSVVAHSYGTDVTTLALTKAHADHVVLLGSAGIADSVTNASALQVPDGQVFASQGHHDGWAVVGQNLSGRADPTAASFGAHDFSSENGVDDQGDPLHAITQHGPLVHSNGSDSYSYFDNNTTAQYNAAKATMGLGDDIPVGDTPGERLLLQAEDRGWPLQGIQP